MALIPPLPTSSISNWANYVNPGQSYGPQNADLPLGNSYYGTGGAAVHPDTAGAGQSIVQKYNPTPAPAPVSYSPPQPQPSAPSAPNFSDILSMLPGYQQALAQEQSGIGQLDALLKQQRERAIINFGDPALASEAGFGIDPQAGAFARQNYLSGNATLARLDKQHKLAGQQIVNQLAAHGILGSGDLGYLSGQENQQYGNNVYDAQQGVLDQLQNAYQSYLSQRQALEMAANQALMGSLSSYLSNPDAWASLFGGSQTPQQPQTPQVQAPSSNLPALTNYSTRPKKPVTGPNIFAFK